MVDKSIMFIADHSHWSELQYKAKIATKYAELVYNGFWFSSLKEALDHFIDFTQRNISGTITLKLYKGRIYTQSRESDYKLYNLDYSSYDTRNKVPNDAGKGFCYLQSLSSRISAINKIEIGVKK